MLNDTDKKLHSSQEQGGFFDKLSRSFGYISEPARERYGLIAALANVKAGDLTLAVSDYPQGLIGALLERGVQHISAVCPPSSGLDKLLGKYPDCTFIAESDTLLTLDVKSAYDIIFICGILPEGFTSSPVDFTKICAMLRPAGRLCVAAPAGRYLSNRQADQNRQLLPEANVLSKAMSGALSVDIVVDSPWLYMVSGVKE